MIAYYVTGLAFSEKMINVFVVYVVLLRAQGENNRNASPILIPASINNGHFSKKSFFGGLSTEATTHSSEIIENKDFILKHKLKDYEFKSVNYRCLNHFNPIINSVMQFLIVVLTFFYKVPRYGLFVSVEREHEGSETESCKRLLPFRIK